MILTNENYYSLEANREYMSVSQYKDFMSCEAMAMAVIRGEWEKPKSKALLVGSYVDSWFEGTLEEFKAENPEIFKKDGHLKAEYVQAEEIINFIQRDPKFMEYMAGKKQVIMTAEFFGTKWKIKIDSYHPGKMIVDGKVMRSMERVMGKSFVEHWYYDFQMAIYSETERRFAGSPIGLETYLAAVTKEEPPDKEVIHIPAWRREDKLSEAEKNMPRILAVKSGAEAPRRCGRCKYCRATKMIDKPIDFELVGLSNEEQRAILGD